MANIAKLPVFDALRQKMNWHQTRQTLLAENVANAETPGYRGRDLRAFAFEEQRAAPSSMAVAAEVTQRGHIAVAGTEAQAPGARRLNSFEITPEGNGITLEDEMMKVTSNQMDFQAATTLYTRSLRILRTALGRQA